MLKELVFRIDIEDLGDYKFYEIVKGDLNQNKIIKTIYGFP